jgi:hypothetical protein
MLVCNISYVPPKTISVAIAEAVTAASVTTTQNAVFTTLVDDPTSVTEIVDAYLGEIILEAASATDTVSILSVVDTAINEVLTATDTQTATSTIIPAIWDSATVASVTLSGGNLVTTNTGTTSTNQGAHVATTSGKTAGKYYFELTWTTLNQPGGNIGIGVGTTTSTYTNMGNSGTTGIMNYRGGSIWSNGSQVSVGSGAWAAGQIAGIAVDLDNRKFWVRLSPSGIWNGNAANNPATNVGGFTIPAGTMIPFATFGGTGGVANNVLTINFGASAFSGAVPSGFISGWPA